MVSEASNPVVAKPGGRTGFLGKSLPSLVTNSILFCLAFLQPQIGVKRCFLQTNDQGLFQWLIINAVLAPSVPHLTMYISEVLKAIHEARLSALEGRCRVSSNSPSRIRDSD